MNKWLRLPEYPNLGRDGTARAQGRAWAPSASRCGHQGRPRALPTPPVRGPGPGRIPLWRS